MVTFEQARQIVHAQFARGFAAEGIAHTVASYGAEDATAWRVIHGSVHDVAQDDEMVIGGVPGDMATLVLKATGEVVLLPIITPGNRERLRALVPFGTWPPGMGVGK